MTSTKIIPRKFQDFTDIPDAFFRFSIRRAEAMRGGKQWQTKMRELVEVIVAIDQLRRVNGIRYYSMDSSSICTMIETVMKTCGAFTADKNIQTVVHEIHVQPFWRNRIKRSHRNRDRVIEGYALTHTVKVTKGGKFNTFQFPASVYLKNEGETVFTLPRDLIVGRCQVINCRQLFDDKHLGEGMIDFDTETNELSLFTMVKGAKEEKEWTLAGKLKVA